MFFMKSASCLGNENNAQQERGKEGKNTAEDGLTVFTLEWGSETYFVVICGVN